MKEGYIGYHRVLQFMYYIVLDKAVEVPGYVYGVESYV